MSIYSSIYASQNICISIYMSIIFRTQNRLLIICLFNYGTQSRLLLPELAISRSTPYSFRCFLTQKSWKIKEQDENITVIWSTMLRILSIFKEVFISDNFYLIFSSCRETTIENNQFVNIMHINIQFILDQTKLLRVPLWIGHRHLCMENHLKLRL